MNASPEPSVPASPELDSATSSNAEAESSNAAKDNRQGKIASLPREQREVLNKMLENGSTQAAIIDHFRALGVILNATNISNWKAGAHQDWLKRRDWVADTNNQSEWASDLISDGTDDITLHQGVIRLAVVQIFKQLKSGELQDDPVHYTRILNALARLSREALCLRKHADATAAARAALLPLRDPKRTLTDEERAAIVFHVDQALGIPTGGLHNYRADPAESSSAAPAGRQQQPGTPTEPQAPETCHACLEPLPPLLPSGKRPQSYCLTCGTPLNDPAPAAPLPKGKKPIERCDFCGDIAPELLPDGKRPSVWCKCGLKLPPVPPPVESTSLAA